MDAVRLQTAIAPSRRDRIGWNVAGRRTVTDSTNLFDFDNRRRQLSLEAGVNWTRTVSSRLQILTEYQVTRTTARLTPFFAHRINVAGDAGIAGGVNWRIREGHKFVGDLVIEWYIGERWVPVKLEALFVPVDLICQNEDERYPYPREGGQRVIRFLQDARNSRVPARWERRARVPPAATGSGAVT